MLTILSSFINKTENEIRQKICNYLSLNKPLFFTNAKDYIFLEKNMTLSVYIFKMRQKSTPITDIEVQIFCELYNCSITDKTSNKVYSPIYNAVTQDFSYET